MDHFSRSALFLSFGDLARASAQEMKKVQDRINALGEPPEFGPEWLEQQDLEMQRDLKALSVIVFSAMLVEAFINDYAARRLGQSYFEAYIDKMDLRAKWVTVPQLATGKSLTSVGETGTGAVNMLNQLIKARNFLVHYKSVDLTEVFSKAIAKGHIVVDEDGNMSSPPGAPNPIAKYDFDATGEARNALGTTEALADELDSIDPQALAGIMMCRRSSKN